MAVRNPLVLSSGRFVEIPAGDTLPASAIPAKGKRRNDNGNFSVNQRDVSGTVILAAGAIGHDRWKAGSSGCTYTFATSGGITTLNISAGSLVQVVNGPDLQTGTHVLSWSGTAQGRIGAGSYGASGVTASITGGTNTNIEFNTGTLSLVQFEPGTSRTSYEHLGVLAELLACQYYLPAFLGGDHYGAGYANSDSGAFVFFTFPVAPRVAPTGIAISGVSDFRLFSHTGSNALATAATFSSASRIAGVILFAAASSIFTTGFGARVGGVGVGTKLFFTGAEL